MVESVFDARMRGLELEKARLEEERQELDTERRRRSASLERQRREIEEEGREQADRAAEQVQRVRERSVDLEFLQAELLCSICQDWLASPASLECGHTFCFLCVDQWLRSGGSECPVCRQEVTRVPVRSKPLEGLVRKTVEKAGAPADLEEHRRREEAAVLMEQRRLEASRELERTVQAALARGLRFFEVGGVWSAREKARFDAGVALYAGPPREAYCKLIGLTPQWLHRATEDELRQALRNLSLTRYLDEQPDRIRRRLLMYMWYG